MPLTHSCMGEKPMPSTAVTQTQGASRAKFSNTQMVIKMVTSSNRKLKCERETDWQTEIGKQSRSELIHSILQRLTKGYPNYCAG